MLCIYKNATAFVGLRPQNPCQGFAPGPQRTEKPRSRSVSNGQN